MGVVARVWAIVKRQNIAIPVECYSVANEVAYVYQSVGRTPSICVDDGPFSDAFAFFTACTSDNAKPTGAMTAVPEIEAPLSYCSSVISSLGQAALKSSLSAPASTSASTTSSLDTTSTLTTVSPTTASTSSIVSPTTTSTPASNHLSPGTIAGIAIGAVIAVLVVLTFVVFFIWRHRRNTKRAKAEAALVAEQATPHKAQLHSDDYKPKREELAGSNVPRKVRAIDGLHEVEYRDLKAGRGELSANEVAAAEKDGLLWSTAGEQLTSIGRSER